MTLAEWAEQWPYLTRFHTCGHAVEEPHVGCPGDTDITDHSGRKHGT